MILRMTKKAIELTTQLLVSVSQSHANDKKYTEVRSNKDNSSTIPLDKDKDTKEVKFQKLSALIKSHRMGAKNFEDSLAISEVQVLFQKDQKLSDQAKRSEE
ncbi:hypothetical protein Ciccas_011738 [Cichlidogyrus casuarinus]|uniref:Uncharacterized protein n=1 Tax=Cichlidogyrus casuarinus TaxID=1844966 RepID=A0ABD2PR26_9PLAT